MVEVSLPIRGGCLCGACRYELRKPPYMVYVCHCTDCRRQSGSAFGMTMPAPRAALALLTGSPSSYPRTLPSGRASVVRFCGVCACRLYAEGSAEVVAIRPGTLDDSSWVRPAAQNCMRSALGWACLADLPGHEQNPPSYEDISRAWRAQGIQFVSR